MAAPHSKLVEALAALQALQDAGKVAIRSSEISRTHRERLTTAGFLQKVMKGWYVSVSPAVQPGDTTSWYAAFWSFCADYLEHRFGTDWSLSPEQSLSLHAGNWAVPRQLTIRSPDGGNKPTQLLFGTSILDIKASLPAQNDTTVKDRLRLYSIPAALLDVPAGYFVQHPIDARVTLSSLTDASELLSRLLAGGHGIIAGRLAGAFRAIGRDQIADDIAAAITSAGHQFRESNPFKIDLGLPEPLRNEAPFANRIRLMWQEMRDQVLEEFPAAPGLNMASTEQLRDAEDKYALDAYHSLSIEGYRVTPEMIERVRSGAWDPLADGWDAQHRSALAARGYSNAHAAVIASLQDVLAGENPGTTARDNHGTWYRDLFAPSVAAGLLRPTDLAGYRTGSVYISQSMHVPPSPDSVRAAMPVLLELLESETNAASRPVLSHFFFVYIHPYSDGNGRIGRFLMNLMLVAGGYPWTVVPLELRSRYMTALEEASTNRDIRPFTRLIAELVSPHGK